jgi:hypothetical protein
MCVFGSCRCCGCGPILAWLLTACVGCCCSFSVFFLLRSVYCQCSCCLLFRPRCPVLCALFLLPVFCPINVIISVLRNAFLSSPLLFAVVFLVHILFGFVLCALVLCVHPVPASWIGSGPDRCANSALKDWSERQP